MDEIVNIPIDPTGRVAFGSVGTVVYRDTVAGVRLTAHQDPVDGSGWIVRHEGHGGDTDGTPVARSALLYGAGELNTAWDAARTQVTR